jgi:hypothetical protein
MACKREHIGEGQWNVITKNCAIASEAVKQVRSRSATRKE